MRICYSFEKEKVTDQRIDLGGWLSCPKTYVLYHVYILFKVQKRRDDSTSSLSIGKSIKSGHPTSPDQHLLMKRLKI